MTFLADLSSDVRQYLLVTGNYWAFTLTDGALRMLVVLHFHSLGYTPLEIALLFLFYEFFGVVTNLVGGWLGARVGLNRTMNIGLCLQILALAMLLVPASLLAVPWVMAAQALSGIAKDLNKMSAKSSVKLLLPGGAGDTDQQRLYHWVAVLTGSKNTLKGVGFFLGGLLLSLFGFRGAVGLMVAGLLLVWCLSLWLLKRDLGRSSFKPKFRDIFSSSAQINRLAAARMFLFGARDVWFVVALPVTFASQFGWSHWQVGSFLALWIIGYGLVQALAPRITGAGRAAQVGGRDLVVWGLLLAVLPAAIALGMQWHAYQASVLTLGLLIFGGLFAINSSLHSYLVVRYARADGVSMDVGFYYMANALGRLLGTVLSGAVFQWYGLVVCLLISAAFVLLAALLGIGLDRLSGHSTRTLSSH